MSLFKMSYGTIPGNGHHKADDKIMNAGPGHVVPGENLHVAKRLISDMGYDPEASVDLNQGQGSGRNIKISSGEFFMNEQQVKELKDKGVNPESLSPNSKYNQSGNNMNGGPNAYASGGGNLYELMMNNNNQYPAYQNAGSTDTDPPAQTAQTRPDMSGYPFHTRNEEGAKWYDDRGNMVYFEGPQGETLDYRNMTQDDWSSMEGYTPEFDVNNPPAGSQQRIQMQPLGQNGLQGRTPSSTQAPVNPEFPVEGQGQDMMYAPGQEPWMQSGSQNPEGVPSFAPPAGYDPRVGNEIGSLPTRKAQPIDNPVQMPGEKPLAGWMKAVADMQGSNTPAGKSPEDQYLDDLIDKNKKSADKEVLANMAMFGWNMSRERQPGEQPQMVHMREMVRDYEGMKNRAAGDLERVERRSAYQLKQLGAPDKIVGLHANTIQGTNQINQSIWDMQGQDSINNAQVANQVAMDYEHAMRQYRMNEAISAQNFKDMKGKNMAENVAQVFDVRDNELSNETTLRGYKKNEEMDELDRQYNSLNKSAFNTPGGGYFSRQDWYKMTPDQRAKYQKASDDYQSKSKVVK